MATFINTNIEWNGEETLEYFLRPLFIGLQPYETQGVRVVPNVRSKLNMNYFSKVQKLLKAYAKGFNPATGSTYTKRVLEVHRMKAEAADDALDFYQTVFERGLRTDDWNNLDETMLKAILVELYQNAVKSDVYRQYWHNDTTKETVSSGVITGTADVDYNSFDGMWKLIFDNAAVTPGDLQIKRVAISNGAVAQVDTVTLTGSSGTCNVAVGGVNYLATFATSIAVTSANFVALHAAALALRGITLTGTSTLIFTSAVPGQPTPTPVPSAAITGDLTGSNVATTANTAPADLSSGESEDIFKELYETSNKVLKATPKNEKYMLVTDTILENYISYLESLGTERAQIQLENGQSLHQYRGIPIIPLSWEIDLEADFAHASGENPAYPHRVIYTNQDNLVLGLNSLNSWSETRMWYNPDEEENRFRSKFEMGVQYVHNELSSVAY